MPSGDAPKIIEYPNGPPDDRKYVAWTCRYAPGNLGDTDPATAWVEGVGGYGIGEVVIVPCLDLKKPVEIWVGYGKSKDLFQYNSRPRILRLVVIEAKISGFAQYGTLYHDLQIIEDETVELEDLNDYQRIKIPDYDVKTFFEPGNREMEHRYFLGLEINEVYEGSKWDDTCISEIRNVVNSSGRQEDPQVTNPTTEDFGLSIF